MPESRSWRCYLSLGSNLGDRAAYLRASLEALAASEGVAVERVSAVYETRAVGLTEQPDFLNLVAQVRTTLPPAQLLALGQRIENDLGRVRTQRWGPRTVDLDLLLCEGFRSDTPELTVPHPRLGERQFVLIPLAEIAPDLVLPDGRTAAQAAQPDTPQVRRWGRLEDWQEAAG